MASVRGTDVQSRPTECLDCPRVPLETFQSLVSPFETAFHAPMAAWRLEGTRRTARRCTVDKTCPCATPEDRLFCMLVSLKTYALQGVQGRLCSMGQSKAYQSIPVLLPALRTLSDAFRNALLVVPPHDSFSQCHSLQKICSSCRLKAGSFAPPHWRQYNRPAPFSCLSSYQFIIILFSMIAL